MAATEIPQHRIAFMPTGHQGTVADGANLLQAARALGLELESICGGRQTCGKCQIAVEEGNFEKHGIHSSANNLSTIETPEAEYWARRGATERRLACAAHIHGDLLINVPEESRSNKQIIAKAATDRVIEVKGAVREIYIQCPPARLEDSEGDWERIQSELKKSWDLTGLSIDIPALRQLQPSLRTGHRAVTVTIWQEKEVIRVRPGYAEGIHGLAIDIGSTTIVAHLCDLRDGRILATEAMMNPQIRFGEDLMSRVSYLMMEAEGLSRLHSAVLEAINRLAEQTVAAAGTTADDIVDLVLVANSVMHHLLLGIDPCELGGAPFALAVGCELDLRARDLGFHRMNAGARVHVLPCVAGQNGGDNVAAILAQAPHRQDEMVLMVDVGTNAEIVLGNRNILFAASSPTGPAFEGAQITHGQRAAPGAVEKVRISTKTLEPRVKLIGSDLWVDSVSKGEQRATGICGSGIIEAVAEMFLAGILDSNGRFVEAAREKSPRVRFKGRSGEYVLFTEEQNGDGISIIITQRDVRAIQLAKAALYAGIKLLMSRANVWQIDRIELAGAFGSFISPWHAMVLGMIPDCDLSRIVAVGNAAGDGARMALVNRELRAEAATLARSINYISLASAADFQSEFVDAMAMPHATDTFSHLESSLPNRASSRPARRRQKIVAET